MQVWLRFSWTGLQEPHSVDKTQEDPVEKSHSWPFLQLTTHHIKSFIHKTLTRHLKSVPGPVPGTRDLEMKKHLLIKCLSSARSNILVTRPSKLEQCHRQCWWKPRRHSLSHWGKTLEGFLEAFCLGHRNRGEFVRVDAQESSRKKETAGAVA
jgi:hypothetical protein